MVEMNEKGEILITPSKYSGTRYNGGWMKTITQIDKSKTNGYSLVGEFIDSPVWIKPYSILLDCGIGGSRKHHQKHYKLFSIDPNGEEIMIAEIEEGKEWAISCWKPIENFLKERYKDAFLCQCGKKAHFTIMYLSEEKTKRGFLCRECLKNNIENIIETLVQLEQIAPV